MSKSTTSQNFNNILAQLRKGIIQPLYILEGQEEYLKEKIVQGLKKLLVADAVKDLDYILINSDNYGDIEVLQKIKNEISTPPFMSKRRLIVVKNSNLFSSNTNKTGKKSSEDKSKNTKQDYLVEMINSTNDYSCLVILEEKIDKRQKKLVNLVLEKGVIGDISKPDIRTIRNWVVNELNKDDITITSSACDNLIERNDGNLLQIKGELNKLSLYVKHLNRNFIEESDVNDIGISDIKGSIFELTDALSIRDATTAFKILDILITQKQPLPLISFMISRHFKQLVIAKNLGSTEKIIKEMKIIPFVANKLYAQSKKINIVNLEKIYNECIESEISVKSSKIPDRLAIELLFGYIMHNIPQ